MNIAMISSQHAYEVRPRKAKRGVDLLSDALPFGRLWCGERRRNQVFEALVMAFFHATRFFTRPAPIPPFSRAPISRGGKGECESASTEAQSEDRCGGCRSLF